MAQEQIYATGKRKTAIARVRITPGTGNISVNKQSMGDYFGNVYFEAKVNKPFALTNSVQKYDVHATLQGGGKSAQMEALVHGIAKALQTMDTEMRAPLKKAGLLTRDARAKERKKYGQRAARARFQFSKR